VIHIFRGAEPASLGPTRADRLAAARKALAAGVKLELDGYGIVKNELFEAQRRKCCYCEKLEEQAKYRDVEHYRPKAHYWWLAWTWDNLLFSCFDCNREYKKDQFPLASGSTRLIAEEAPPGNEYPLVIDPCDLTTDPMNEIEFRRERIQGKERWKPYGLTVRGSTTVEVCGLDRPGLLTLYTDHVVHVVRPKLQPLFEAHEAGDAKAVFKAWERAKRSLLDRARAFRALSHDALAVLVSDKIRTGYNLRLDHPT
jgi:uncharacterized protein (TIGR02646 family)